MQQANKALQLRQLAKKQINAGELVKQKIKKLKEQKPNRWSAVPLSHIKESTVTAPKINQALDNDEYEIEICESDSLKQSNIAKIKTYFKFTDDKNNTRDISLNIFPIKSTKRIAKVVIPSMIEQNFRSQKL